MMSNNPVFRPRLIKRKFFERFPDDLRPGRLSRMARALQHRDRGAGPAGVVLLPRRLADGDRRVRHAVLPLRHPVVDTDGGAAGVERLHDVQRAGAVRRARRAWGWAICRRPLPIVLFVVVAGTVVLGNLFPRKVSFLPGMRYYAGNWDATLWCVKPSADAKIANGIVSIASMPQAQMERYYGSPETAQMYRYMGYAFRAFNTHGRAMFTLAHRAMAGHERGRLLADRRRADLFAPPSAGTSAMATCTTSN